MISFMRFLKDRRGGVAPMFALAIIPVVGLVGAAVDYSRANSIRTALQAALDATALAMAKSAPTLTAQQLQDQSSSYFQTLFNRPDAKNVSITATYSTTGGSQLLLTASGAMDTTFTRVMGVTQLSLGSSSTIKWGNQRLRVALVLDTTGSMASAGKIDALQTATKNLIDQLKAAATTNGDIYVSIVPFARTVNGGPANYNASWIDWTAWEDEPPYIKTNKPGNWDQIGPDSSCPFTNSNNGFRCTTGPDNGSPRAFNIPSSGTYSGYICPGIDNGSKIQSQASIYYNGCYDSQPTTTTSQDTVCSGSGSCSCSGYSNCSCTGNGNNKVCKQTVTNTGAPYTHNWIKNPRSTWNGCIADRGDAAAPSGQNYDQLVTAPVAGTAASYFPAQQYGYCSPQVMGLSYDWNTMKTLVDGLFPNGSTNQPIGLVWGWQSLVGGGPFTAPAKDPNYTYREVIILLSDGLNTQDRWYGDGSNQSAQVDTRMYNNGPGTCSNIKNSGITIYTIQVNTDGDPLSTLLQNCATDSSKFVMLTTANQIVTTFQQIGTQLSKLRIAM